MMAITKCWSTTEFPLKTELKTASPSSLGHIEVSPLKMILSATLKWQLYHNKQSIIKNHKGAGANRKGTEERLFKDPEQCFGLSSWISNILVYFVTYCG